MIIVLRYKWLNSKINIVKYASGSDVNDVMDQLDIGAGKITCAYFSGDLKNPPHTTADWSYFSMIIIQTRAIAFSPSLIPNAIAMRQYINDGWGDWEYV